MSWDRIKGMWYQFKGSARAKRGELTDDEVGWIAGSR